MVQLYEGGGVLGGGGAAGSGNVPLPNGGGIAPLPMNWDGISPFLSWKPEAMPASSGPNCPLRYPGMTPEDKLLGWNGEFAKYSLPLPGISGDGIGDGMGAPPGAAKLPLVREPL